MKATPDGTSRKCRKCGIDFAGKRCLACAKAYSAQWREANPEKASEHKKNWVHDPQKKRDRDATYRIENRQREAARAEAYRAANPEKAREAVRKSRAKNPERSRQLAASSRAKNAESNRARVKAWIKQHPEKVRVIRQNRRARKLDSEDKLSPGLAKRLFALQRGKCACCGAALGTDYHMDHIMPLALGGANVDSNIQLLTKECNSRKHAKHPVDYMQERGFLL